MAMEKSTPASPDGRELFALALQCPMADTEASPYNEVLANLMEPLNHESGRDENIL
jgi:hypothetical protein